MTARKQVRQALMAMSDKIAELPERPTSQQLAEISEELRRRLIDYGSYTPENVNDVEYIGLSPTKYFVSDDPVVRLSTLNSNIPLSTIISYCETMEIPHGLRAKHPKLTQAEWKASFRFAVILLCAFSEDG